MTTKKATRIEVKGTLIRSHITPETSRRKVGDRPINLTNQACQDRRTASRSTYNCMPRSNRARPSGGSRTDKEGVYPYYCTGSARRC